MSERKYRQRGYQDEAREPRREQRPVEKKEYAPRGQPPISPKTFSTPGFRAAVRCVQCGNELSLAMPWAFDARCARCGVDLHACAQCASFDGGAPFECQKTVPFRITPKDVRNTCPLFEPRTTVERETKAAAPASARQAFDDLFK